MLNRVNPVPANRERPIRSYNDRKPRNLHSWLAAYGFHRRRAFRHRSAQKLLPDQSTLNHSSLSMPLEGVSRLAAYCGKGKERRDGS